MGALLTNSSLGFLRLSHNNFTARGCQSLAGLLEQPKSNLEELYLTSNGFGDEGARTFANAMATNSKLKTLGLYDTGITAEGWSSSFSKVLCDTSSVNNTFRSSV